MKTVIVDSELPSIILIIPHEVVKKPYKSAILLFTLSFFFFLIVLQAFGIPSYQADLKRFMHMRQPLRNYFGSDLLNTIEDMFSLFGGNLHGGVIRGRWCLKLVFG